MQKVVSPYLGTHGLYSGDDAEDHCCVLGETGVRVNREENVLSHSFGCRRLSEKRFVWGWSKSTDQLSKTPVVRSKSYNIPLLLTPVAEYDPDAGSVGSGGIRRHSACEIITCLEEQGLVPGPELSSSSSNRLCVGPQFKGIADQLSVLAQARVFTCV